MKTTYCIVEASNYNGKKCAPAFIFKEFKSRKAAEHSNSCHGVSSVVTRKQAEKYIAKWNEEFEEGIYDINP